METFSILFIQTEVAFSSSTFVFWTGLLYCVCGNCHWPTSYQDIFGFIISYYFLEFSLNAPVVFTYIPENLHQPTTDSGAVGDLTYVWKQYIQVTLMSTLNGGGKKEDKWCKFLP